MKHPAREEWIPFLFGEANAKDQQKLTVHLERCPECTQQIGSWRRSLKELDSWPLPRVEPRSGHYFAPAIKWALAALVVLGIGFLVGRTNGRSELDRQHWRAELEASVRSTLQAEMHLAFLQFQDETSNTVRNVEARLTKATAAENQRVRNEFADVLNAARTQDGQNVQVALERLQQQHEADLIALRKDLETLASATDDEIRRASVKLTQLAALQNNE